MSGAGSISLWVPGRITRRAVKTTLVSVLIFLTVVGSIGPWLPEIIRAFADLSPTGQPLGTCSLASSNSTLTPTKSANQCSSLETRRSNTPNFAEAGPLPNLSLPKTVLSSVDTLIGSGGVIQDSPQNLTLYNSAIALRLLGGVLPHDQLLGPDRGILSSWSFWGVEANVSGVWVALRPVSNNFTVIGTNATGSFVVRTMQVRTGGYSGLFNVVYKATSAGPLKWDLKFSSGASGQYRLIYSWNNITNRIESFSKRFLVRYPTANYTLAWDDISSSGNVSVAVMPTRFLLSIDLGRLGAGSGVLVDPSIVSSSSFGGATAYPFQRKVIFDPLGGYYFVFYYDGFQVTYRSYYPGLPWSSPLAMPPGWPAFRRIASSYLPTLLVQGEKVLIAGGEYGPSDSNLVASASLFYASGNFSGPRILWGPTIRMVTFTYTGVIGFDSVRLVSMALSSAGQPVFSFEETYFPGGYPTNKLYVLYGSKLLQVDSNGYYFPPGGSSNPDVLFPQMGSAVAASDPNGRMRVVYQTLVPGPIGYVGVLRSMWFNQSTNGTIEQLDSVPFTNEFSLMSDSNYGLHLTYRGYPLLNVTYGYRAPSDPGWTFTKNLFQGTAGFPVLTLDYSTNDVYAFAVKGSPGSSIMMRTKSLAQSWSDRSISFAITGRKNATFLGSNLLSASASNSSSISLVWTEGMGSGPYNVTFAAIPIESVWSPYASPADPWDGNGLAPYGQYFQNLGESVSPSTGMLTIRMMDLDVPGRGLNLDFTRVFTEPYSFLSGSPYSYESYPWAPMGDGWQFDFPWMNNTGRPLYVHLWNGEGYRIPSNFWNGTTSTLESHQGESFRLVRTIGGSVVLYDRSGTSYNFDPVHRLVNITDATGSNYIKFAYSSNRISMITDTIGRTFLFCYSGLLASIMQAGGTCSAPVGLVRTIQYSNNGQSLTAATDPAGRTTVYLYGASPWLPTRITFPTGWYDAYGYTNATLGTEATSYRVSMQETNVTQTSDVRQFIYTYTPGPGDQIANSTVASYDGSQLVGYTRYGFSFAGMIENMTNYQNILLHGVQQRFGVHGEIPREIVLVGDGKGIVGSYTNYYRYDAWGNRIYSRKVINPSSGSIQESYQAYYNDGLPPGFRAFQETFGMNNHTSTDNPWSVDKGYWMVKNGVYNGTETAGAMEDTFAWADLNMSDLSIQARVFIGNPVNNSPTDQNRVGIFVHYPGSGSHKWALVLRSLNGGTVLELLDEWNIWLGDTYSPARYSCAATPGWYTFSLAVQGFQAFGSALRPDGTLCAVSGDFPTNSPAAVGTSFGLYSGGYSTLFTNVTAITFISPCVTVFITGCDSFIPGAPGPNIHGALAGEREFQNSTWNSRIDSYYSYYPWGGLNQVVKNNQAITSDVYDTYGHLVQSTDARGNQTNYSYSAIYKSAYLTATTRTLIPGRTTLTQLYSYNLTMGTMLSTVDPRGFNTTYRYDILGRMTRTTYPTGDYQAYIYNDKANYVNVTNENGWLTQEVYDGLGRLSTTERFLNGIPYSTATSAYNWQDRVSSSIDGLGNITSYQYDAMGRLISTARPDSTSLQEYYNDTGSWVRTTDQNNVYNCQVYDRLGRLLSVVENASSSCQSGTVTNYNYDEVGNLIKVTTSTSQVTTYAYDNLNRLVKTSYPDHTNDLYSYDRDNNLVTRVDRKGLPTSYGYDSLNRRTTVTYQGSAVAPDQYNYDNNGNLVQLQSQNATISYSYDSRNRLVSETYSVVTGFVMSSSLSSMSIEPGFSGSTVITLTSFNAFAGTVSLAASASTGSVSASFAPTSVILSQGGSSTSTLKVTASPSAVAGVYNLTITGTSTGVVHTIVIPLIITDYTLGLSPNSLTLGAGRSMSVTVTVQSLSGYSGSIGLSVGTGFPSCATSPTFSPNTLKLSGSGSNSSNLTFSLLSGCNPAQYSFSITGVDAIGLSHSAIFALTISGFSVSNSPSIIGIQQGYTGSVSVSVASINQYTGSVNPSLSSTPSGVTPSFTPSTVPVTSSAPGVSTLSLAVASRAPSGTFPLTVQASDSYMTRNGNMTLIVGSYGVSVSPASISVQPGGTAMATIFVSQDVGASGSLTLSFQGPSCITSSFSPATLSLPAGGSSTLTLNASSSCPMSSNTVTVSTGKKGAPSVSFTLNIVNLSFALAVSPATVSLVCTYNQCNPTSATSTLTVTSLNRFSGNITISYQAQGSNGGTSVTGPLWLVVPSGGNATGTITASIGTSTGTYVWTILGTWNTLTSNANLTISELVCSHAPCPTIPTSSSTPTAPSTPTSPATSSPSQPYIGSVTYTVNYTYTGELLTKITYPDGITLNYTYDLLGRNTAVYMNTAVLASFSYSKNDQLVKIVYANGIQTSYAYDSLSRPLQIMTANSTSTLLLLNYAYYKTGTVRSVTGNSVSTSGSILPVNEQYNYDALGRLDNATVTSGGATTNLWYMYDNVGNRVWQSLNGTLEQYNYTQTNNELTVSSGTPKTYYSYDKDGSQVGRAVGTAIWNYTWDPSGDLVKVTSGGSAQGAYAYDGSGRRVESFEGTATTLYAYQGSETLYEEQLGGWNTHYVYAAGKRIFSLGSITQVFFYHTDALGSTRLITSPGGKVTFANGYQPFGQDNRIQTGSMAYKFTGKPVSQTTGLYYYYHRWYDSSTGRFISADPAPGQLSSPQTLNTYIYAVNRPTGLTDPSGLDACNYWNPFTWVGCANNAAQTVNNVVIQPAENFVNNNVVKPLVNNVVVPLVNNVLIPLAVDYVAANSYVSQGLNQVGSQMWNGYQSFTKSVLDEQQSFYHSVNQDLQGFAHDITHLQISNVNQFFTGLAYCGALIGLAALAYFALPEIAAGEAGALIAEGGAAAVGAAGAGSLEYDKGMAELISFGIGLAIGCGGNIAASISISS